MDAAVATGTPPLLPDAAGEQQRGDAAMAANEGLNELVVSAADPLALGSLGFRRSLVFVGQSALILATFLVAATLCLRLASAFDRSGHGIRQPRMVGPASNLQVLQADSKIQVGDALPRGVVASPGPTRVLLKRRGDGFLQRTGSGTWRRFSRSGAQPAECWAKCWEFRKASLWHRLSGMLQLLHSSF